MCNRPDCPNPVKGSHLRNYEELQKHKALVGEPPLKPTDMMPDGFHAKPKRIRSDRFRKPTLAEFTPDEALNITKKIQKKYNKLPEPRPEWAQWFMRQVEPHRVIKLFITSVSAERESDQIKAAQTLNDAYQLKPKHQVEISSPNDEIRTEELLAMVCDTLGGKDAVMKMLSAKPTGRIDAANSDS